MYEFSTEDCAYQQHGDQPLLARVYTPRGAGPFPAVVDVHGGGWTTGDRLLNKAIHEDLAKNGIVVAALDFRMPPEARYPEPIADINLGIRWFKAHAHRFGSEPERVGGLGTSSGAHQLLLAALLPRDPRYARLPRNDAPQVDASLRFLVACWPVADPWARYQMVKANGNQRLVDAHHAYWPGEEEMREGNPQLVLERRQGAELPPMLTMQGTADDNLTPDMAERFAETYRKAGGYAEFERFEGQPHAFVTRDPASAASASALAAIRRFIARHSPPVPARP